jgi:aerobic carbon-monoxide dehydrogenase medium subunit
MIPGSFTYLRPGSLDEAIGLLGQHAEDGKLLAGGQSLIPIMRFRLAEPAYLIDINRIPALDGITETSDGLSIGALTREYQIDRSEAIRQRYPILVDTASMIADPLVRNLATVGGNLAHADPANDHPATMLALRASVVARGPQGERVIPIDDLFVEAFTTSLRPDEILTEIRIPKPSARSGAAYLKFERKVGDYAIAATAACLELGADGTISRAGVALANASYMPLRAAKAEAVLTGQPPSALLFKEAAEAASAEADPGSDLRGSADYKRAMIRTMTTRALRLAAERAGVAVQ